MNRFSIFIALIISAVFAENTFASDSTKIKKSLFLLVSAGLTTNTVYGTMVGINKQFDNNIKMENKNGYIISVNLEKQFSNTFFLETGLDFVQKQVDPMVNSSSVYKDKLKTAYLSIPLVLGINLLPVEKSLNLAFIIGTSTNLKTLDKSNSGPDRASFKASFVSQSFCTGVRLSFIQSPKNRFFLQYKYIQDITNSYVEGLYYGLPGPITEYNYKYKTHVISIGLQWPLK